MSTSNVSINDLAPCPPDKTINQPNSPVANRAPSPQVPMSTSNDNLDSQTNEIPSCSNDSSYTIDSDTSDIQSTSTDSSFPSLRRSDRFRRPPQRYGHNIFDK